MSLADRVNLVSTPRPEIDVEQWLTNWEHRPGWVFRIERVQRFSVLVIEFEAVDSYHWRRTHEQVFKLQTFRFPLPDFLFWRSIEEARSMFDHIVRDSIHQVEMHEMYEFLQCNGKLVNDPHKEGKRVGRT